MDEMDEDVMAVPRDPASPRVKVRALHNYCKSKGADVKPSDLSPEELERFLVWPESKHCPSKEKPESGKS